EKSRSPPKPHKWRLPHGPCSESFCPVPPISAVPGRNAEPPRKAPPEYPLLTGSLRYGFPPTDESFQYHGAGFSTPVLHFSFSLHHPLSKSLPGSRRLFQQV